MSRVVIAGTASVLIFVERRKTSLTIVRHALPSHMRCEVTSSRSLSRSDCADSAELRLIRNTVVAQLAFPAEIILLHPSKDAQRTSGAQSFVVQSVRSRESGCAMWMLSLHPRERQPQPLRMKLPPVVRSRQCCRRSVLDGGQLSSHASPPVTLNGELLSIAICSARFLAKGGNPRCRSSKVRADQKAHPDSRT